MFILEYLQSQNFVKDVISGMVSDSIVATIAFFFGIMSYNFTKYKNSDTKKRSENENSDPILERDIRKKEERSENNQRVIYTKTTSTLSYKNDKEGDYIFVVVTILSAILFFKIINFFVIGILAIWYMSLLILLFFIYDYVKSKSWAPTQTALCILCLMNGVFIPLTIRHFKVPSNFKFDSSIIFQYPQLMKYMFMFLGAILILMPTILLVKLIGRVFFIVIFNKKGSKLAYNYILKTDNLVNKPVALFFKSLFINILAYLFASGFLSELLNRFVER